MFDFLKPIIDVLKPIVDLGKVFASKEAQGLLQKFGSSFGTLTVN